MMDREKTKHEAFGQISFTRTTGTGRFYGSELEQDHYISMELHESEINRTLSQDWYTAGKLLARVRMTAGQFSEMITSMNRGSGVCCTVEFAGKKMQPLPEYENRKEFVHRKFEDRMTEFAQKLQNSKERVKELANKKTLNKNEQRELVMSVEFMTSEISNNIPFFAKCFQETVDEVVQEGKLEVENAIQHKLTTLGMEAWQTSQNTLKQ